MKTTLLLLTISTVVCLADDPTTKELDAVIAKYGKQLYTVKSYTSPRDKDPVIGFTHSTRSIQLPPPSLPQPAPTPTPPKK